MCDILNSEFIFKDIVTLFINDNISIYFMERLFFLWITAMMYRSFIHYDRSIFILKFSSMQSTYSPGTKAEKAVW